MASNSDLVQYIVDQCAAAGVIEAKKMFGDYGLYCNGKLYGLISDNGLYIKPTEECKRILKDLVMRPPYEGAKPYFYIEDIDNSDYLAQLVHTTCEALPAPKPKKDRKKEEKEEKKKEKR